MTRPQRIFAVKNKYRILIVEDDEVIARSIQKLMGDWGWEACCVEDFSKVLDTFASYNPHLVILDIALPACNGFYWCMEIRKISRVPVVFYLPPDNMNIVIAMNMGGDDFIAKPLTGTCWRRRSRRSSAEPMILQLMRSSLPIRGQY